jgi:NADPH-dependent 2,4-dienoyl-CoA reductase/sulfur reductase-like enzyme
MTKHYVIIGGDAAGMSAAMQIRRTLPEADITTFEMGGIYSYAQCGLPYFIGEDIPTTDKLIARTAEQFNEKHRINAHTYHEVTEIHPQFKKITVKDLKQGQEFQVDYDKLLIATGGSPVMPNWKGKEAEGVFYLKTIPDAEAIHDMAKSPTVEEVVIVGAGYIGLEMVEAFHQLGKKVTLIQRGEQIANVFDKELAKLAEEYLKEQQVRIVLGEDVVEVLTTDGKVSGVKTDRSEYKAQLVLVSIGITPNTKMAEVAGIQLGVKNAIEINERMETSLPDIYAAGDCATQFHRVKNRPDYIPLGTTANKQGRIAGTVMAGGNKTFAGIVGSSVLKVLDFHMARTGLSEKEANELGIPYETVTIDSQSHAGYYPDSKKMTLKLIYTKDDQRLLGGQAVGFGGVDKRIDVLATALFNNMTLVELEDLDLSYAPPFNMSWDPIQQAARVAQSKGK